MFWQKRKSAYAVVDRYVSALNARDAETMIALLHDDACFVDSQGFRIEGIAASREGVYAFLRIATGFKMTVASRTRRGDDILLRGHLEADDPRLATETLWRVRVENGKVRYWQSFGGPDAPALAHILLPEKSLTASG